MTNYCPACEMGVLTSLVVDKQLPYDGELVAVRGIEISVCPVCEERVVLPAQSRRNEVRYADAKRAHDGLLTSDAIVNWRKHLGITQAKAAKLVGGGANAFSKYERGEVVQSRPMDLLMRVASAVPDARDFLLAHAGVGGAIRAQKTIVSEPAFMADWTKVEGSLFAGILASSNRSKAANEELGPWHAEACNG